MRWANCFRRLVVSSPAAVARRRLRLAVISLEERAVPSATGTETDPTDPIAIVKEGDTIITIDDMVGDPAGGTGNGIIIRGSGDVVPEAKILESNPISTKATVTQFTKDPPDPVTPPKPPLPQIGDKVWRDLNGNGMQEAGEPGIPFVTLQLYQGSTLVGATTTDGVGAYAFNMWNVKYGTTDPTDDGLKANTDYQIRIAANQSALVGLRPTMANLGTSNADEQHDSDAAAGANAATIDFTMGTDEIYSHYDFGYTPAATVGDLVWMDSNNNGKKDKNESGMAGVTLRLLDAIEGLEVATTTSGSDGKYLFTGLMPGSYVVEVASSNFATDGVLKGFTSSSGKVGEGEAQIVVKGDNLDQGTSMNGTVRGTAVTMFGEALDNRTQDFGFFRATSLSGKVFLDKNGNGNIDPEDTTGLPKMRIRIAGPAGTFTTTTDDDGNYQFKNLLAGAYSVVELNQPPGYRSTTPNFGTVALEAGSGGTMNFGEAQAVDLRMTQIAGRAWVNVGGYLTLTYRVKNVGSLMATGVVINAPLPAGYKVIGSDTMVNATYERLTQRALIGTLAPGAEAIVKIRLQSNRTGIVQLKATAQANEPEEVMHNNKSVVTIATSPKAPSIIPRWLFSHG